MSQHVINEVIKTRRINRRLKDDRKTKKALADPLIHLTDPIAALLYREDGIAVEHDPPMYTELRVAEWHFKGRSTQDMADLLGITVGRVRAILNKPKVRQHVAKLKEMKRALVERADEGKMALAAKGFDHTVELVEGKGAPNRVRFDAAKLAMAMDPLGRYETYKDRQEREREPLDGELLGDYIERAKRMQEAVEVNADAGDSGTIDSDAESASAEFQDYGFDRSGVAGGEGDFGGDRGEGVCPEFRSGGANCDPGTEPCGGDEGGGCGDCDGAEGGEEE